MILLLILMIALMFGCLGYLLGVLLGVIIPLLTALTLAFIVKKFVFGKLRGMATDNIFFWMYWAWIGGLLIGIVAPFFMSHVSMHFR